MEYSDFMSCTVPVREQSIKAMAKRISDNADGMARVIGVDLNGFTDKCAGLLANLVMDAHDGRLLRDPVTMAAESIQAAEESGDPLSLQVQDEMAQEAMGLSEYWRGNKSLSVTTVFWNMLQWGRFPLYRSHEWHERMSVLAGELSNDAPYMRALERLESAVGDLRAFAGNVLSMDPGRMIYPGPVDAVSGADRQKALNDFIVPYCVAQDEYRTARQGAFERLGVGFADMLQADTMYDRRAVPLLGIDALRQLMEYYRIDPSELNDMVEDKMKSADLQ